MTAKLQTLIVAEHTVGRGFNDNDPIRGVTAIFDTDGELIVEIDSFRNEKREQVIAAAKKLSAHLLITEATAPLLDVINKYA